MLLIIKAATVCVCSGGTWPVGHSGGYEAWNRVCKVILIPSGTTK